MSELIHRPGDPLATEVDDLVERLERRELVARVRSAPPSVDLRVLIDCAPETMFALLTDYDELPRYISGLADAEVIDESAGTSSVRFTMKLPFPVGRIRWTNRVLARQSADAWRIEWTLLGGDLEVNEGWLVMTRHRGQPRVTDSRYRVSVATRSRLPSSAERLATRWLLPRIVGGLRRVAEDLEP